MGSKKRLNVLVTGSNAPGFSSIVRCLKLSRKYEVKIISSDWKINLKGKFYGHSSYVLPDNRSSKFVVELLKVCRENEVDILFPIRTDDQVPICNYLKEFTEIGTIPIIVTPNPELMEISLNKRKMLDYIKNVANLETLDYHIVNNRKAFELALKQLNYPNVPVAIKPSHATGRRGFRVLDESLDRKKLFFSEKPTNVFSTKKEILETLGDDFQEMLIMEYLQEPEFTVDVLCYKGKTFAIVPRKRVRTSDGITVKGIIEKLNKQTEDYIKKIVESFGFSFSIGLQFRQSSINPETFHLMEINPRLQGTTVFTVAAGVNIMELLIDMAFKEFNFDYKPKIRYGPELERVYYELFKYNNDVYSLDELLAKE